MPTAGWDDRAELQERQEMPVLLVRDPPADTGPELLPLEALHKAKAFGDLKTNRTTSNC